jgi:hypothetical protein
MSRYIRTGFKIESERAKLLLSLFCIRLGESLALPF